MLKVRYRVTMVVLLYLYNLVVIITKAPSLISTKGSANPPCIF